MLRARERFSVGKLSAIIEKAAGERPASPTPTPMRARNSMPKLLAMPQAAVIALQNNTLTKISLRREPRSANQPKGIPIRV